MEVKSSWATPSMREVPFWRNDMTVDEYEIEHAYYYGNFYTLAKKGLYTPIWKQKMQDKMKVIAIDANWATPYMKGFDFWYDGMSTEEYIEKSKLYFQNLNNQ